LADDGAGRGQGREGLQPARDAQPLAHAGGVSADPVIRSLERGEEWKYCFVDDVAWQ